MKINQNVKLRQGGRNAVKMSKEEFEKKIMKFWKSNFENISDWMWGNVNPDKYDIDNLLPIMKRFIPSVEKDLKVEFDTENIEAVMKMTKSDVPYILVRAGGDWELPVYSMIYHDGKKFRAYVPTKGNLYNRLTNEALGNDDEKDAEFLKKELGDLRQKNYIIDDEDDDYEYYDGYDDEYDDVYDDEYDVSDIIHGRLEEDLESCIEDFETRLSVVG